MKNDQGCYSINLDRTHELVLGFFMPLMPHKYCLPRLSMGMSVETAERHYYRLEGRGDAFRSGFGRSLRLMPM